MALRTVLLRLMLWSLGLAAAIGALAMLFFRAELIWRIVATAATTGVCSGGLLVFSALSEREKSRTAGLLGMAFIAVEFPLGLLAIWTIETRFPHIEEIGMTIAALVGCAIPAMVLLRVREQPSGRAAGSLGAILSAAVLVLVLAAIWSPGRWKLGPSAVGEELAESAGTLSLLSPIAIASLFGLGFDRRHWRWAGVLAALVAYIMALAGIWGHLKGGDAFAIVVTAGMYMALANVVYLCPLAAKREWVRLGVLACAALCAAFTDFVIVSGPRPEFDVAARLAGASGILAACGCLALAVLALLDRHGQVRRACGEIREYAMICPACGKKQTIPAGDARCRHCGLEIQTRFGAPCSPAGERQPEAPLAGSGSV